MGKTLYITDLDGTLLNRQDRVNAFSCQVINSLIERGMLFTYATARSFVSASVVTEGLAVRTPVIAHNGATLFRPDTGEALYRIRFTQEEMDRARSIIHDHEISPLVYSIIDGEEKVSWDVERENEGIRNYLSRRQGDRRLRPVQGSQALYEGEIFYFTCIDTCEKLAPLYQAVKIEESYYCNFQQELYQPEYWCEIMPREATKANAIIRLKAMLECDRVVAFGDALNDIPMFQIADECYAVENAVEELKALATGTIASNEQDGVAKWLLEHSVCGKIGI